MAEHWLKVKEAAALWRVCPQTVRRWIKAGLIEGTQLPGKTMRVVVITPDKETDHGVQGQEEAVRAVMQ